MSFSIIKKYILIILCLSIFSACKQSSNPVLDEKKEQKISKKLVEINKALVRQDKLRITGYLKRNNIEMKETGTGLWYSILKKGNGSRVKKGDRVNLDYAVSLLDGTKCYNSTQDGIKSFIVGKGGVESGLEEGIMLLHEGDKAKFILPPHLAHGLTGDGKKIPARAIIIYDIELISIQSYEP